MLTPLLLLLIAVVSALRPAPSQITTLVTFGDSYTDITLTVDGATTWPIPAAQYRHLELYPFARGGATCSNNLTPLPYPSVLEDQLPLFFEETRNGSLHINMQNTVFTLWIGTNDVGGYALLTGSQVPGVTLVDTVSCAVSWVKLLYKNGARNFIFQNMIPLQHTILYSADSYPNRYWNYPRNTTEWSIFMTELTTSGNTIAKLMLQDLSSKLPGAHVGLFDSHSLFSDMIARPQLYLNGTAPLNVTGAINTCVVPLGQTVSCPVVQGTDCDSYLWYDELHPSQQAHRVVAREIVAAINRTSNRWITWFS